MELIDELPQLLKQILDDTYPDKAGLVKSFQNKVWDDKSLTDKALNQILSEIAYDLDFYVPKDEHRKESPSYYGDDRLKEVVSLGINKIEEHTKLSQ